MTMGCPSCRFQVAFHDLVLRTINFYVIITKPVVLVKDALFFIQRTLKCPISKLVIIEI